MDQRVVISLYDFTGEAVRPWAIAGYECVCFDIQHSKVDPKIERYQGGGAIKFLNADLHDLDILSAIAREYKGRVAFLMAFPVCTDLAGSGAAHFANKRENDPIFDLKAAEYAAWCARLGDTFDCPYFIENPIGTLSTLWRKPDHKFDPFEYGGYIPEDEAAHPKWPEYIAPFDAYPKRTCLWVGGGFTMPEKRPVDCPKGYSTQHKKLGGRSMKTKNIRSATPRGFANAIAATHAGQSQC